MGRRKTYDRDEVLDRAMHLFWKTGYEGAHLSALVEVTGLNRFSLYKEFDGKEGLFEHALERYLEMAQEVYEEHLGQEPLGLDNIHSYFNTMHFGPEFLGCFMINTLTERCVVPDSAYEMAKQFSEDAEQLFFKNLKAARTNGDLPTKADVSVLAKVLLTFDQGLAIFGITQPSTRIKNRIVKAMLEHLFAGAHG